jgi:hypothetical protein
MLCLYEQHKMQLCNLLWYNIDVFLRILLNRILAYERCNIYLFPPEISKYDKGDLCFLI